MDSVYAALSGKEIRDVIKRQVIEEIDKIPLLKAGNCFHRAQIDVGFTISAYPADVPCPEGEFSYIVQSEPAKKKELDSHFESVEELKIKVEKLQKQSKELNLIREAAEQALKTVLETETIMIHEDGTVPDKVRISNNLSVPVVKKTGLAGQKSEVMVSSSNFKRI